MPGILIFRRFSKETPHAADGYPIREALLVFVVPEMPTNGVNGPAFFAALRMAGALSRKKIGYLAPSFSGSFESLSALINSWNSVASGNKITGTLYSGTATSALTSERFKERTSLDIQERNCAIARLRGTCSVKSWIVMA